MQKQHHHHDLGEILHDVEHAAENALHHLEESAEHALHHLEETVHDVYEGLQEEELIAEGHHKKLDRIFLLMRNVAVSFALVLFLLSLFHFPAYQLFKAIAYFFGAGAYVMEFLLLTDCFSRKVPHSEMFMAYCFGPLYVLLGLGYLLH